MDQPPVDQERLARIRQARQVLAGSDLQPPPAGDPLGIGRPAGPHLGERLAGGGSLEFRYFIALAVLVVLAALVWAIWGTVAASPILFLLAIGLLLGWFVL